MFNLDEKREQFNIVFIGHVDHGKSTIIGRLLADTNSLPAGKLEFVKDYCQRNSKRFEYAYLLDALKEEQSQGITIDSARCFFKTNNRNYLILDAPGHFEFIKNMVTGASRADGAIIVIDAHEGIKENSKRHGYLLTMLGIQNICIAVNKMDLVGYSEEIFNQIVNQYSEFLKTIGIGNCDFIPISAINGENIAFKSGNMNWYNGQILLDKIESWELTNHKENLPFRFYVQDIYKFTSHNDERRILAGTIDTGKITKGERVKFLPSNKISTIESIEYFPEKLDVAYANQSIGFVIKDPFYISPGEMMIKVDEEDKAPKVSDSLIANIFWMDNDELDMNKVYEAKLGTQKIKIKIQDIIKIIDSSDPSNEKQKSFLERFDIGVCKIITNKPVAYDLIKEIQETARFVVINNYHIAGCGIIVDSLKENTESTVNFYNKKTWILTKYESYKEHSKLIVLDFENENKAIEVSRNLIDLLDSMNLKLYFNYNENLLKENVFINNREDELKKLAEAAYLLCDAGITFITGIYKLGNEEKEILKELIHPYELYLISLRTGLSRENDNQFVISSDVDYKKLIKLIKNILK